MKGRYLFLEFVNATYQKLLNTQIFFPRYKKNIIRRQQKPQKGIEDEDPYAEPSKSVLSKYDEEINGETVDSFVLGILPALKLIWWNDYRIYINICIGILGKESSQLEKIKQKLSVKNKLLAKKEIVSLNSSALKLASDYFTEEEMINKFKKPSKKVTAKFSQNKY